MELYKNSPFELYLAGSNPKSGFTFEVKNLGEGEVSLTNFQINEDKIKTVVKGHLGDTLQTPVGSLVLVPTDSDHKFKNVINVSWSNSMAVAKGYSKRLDIAVTSKESSVLVISLDDTYPSRASSILSTLIDVYNEVWISNKNRAAINTTEFINERLVVISRATTSLI